MDCCSILSAGLYLFHEKVILRTHRSLTDLSVLCKHMAEVSTFAPIRTMGKAQGGFKSFLLLAHENMKNGESHPLNGKTEIKFKPFPLCFS